MNFKGYWTSCSPPEDFIGADKLLAEARFGSIKGPLKLGVLRTSQLTFSVEGLSFSLLVINKITAVNPMKEMGAKQ